MTPQNREDLSVRVRHWLSRRALPYWRSEGLDPDGGFAESLGLDGKSQAVPRRVFVQMRQVCVYAQAGALGLSPGGVELARRVFDDVLAWARLPGGGFAYSLMVDRGIANPARDTYTHAFLLKAASALYRASGDKAVLLEMEEITGATEALRDPGGIGYAENDKPNAMRRQNPHMHLLGAFLAAHAATGDAAYLNRASEIYGLFQRFFFDSAKGVLREFYIRDLLPAPGADGEIVEGGHHYQWVSLLGEWARASGNALPWQAETLYRFAAAHAHERTTGLIYRENNADGAVRNAGKRAWPLAEAIRAAITMADHAGTELDPQADQYVDTLFRYFLDRPRPGAWLDTLGSDNVPAVTASAASNFYHVFMAFIAYIRFSKRA
jgi:mannose/cellobiose epimerase-like protein (N-acyl-D-glucosamine 2-epimerase family)